jgi:RNA-directed DNA polymerase
MNVLQYLCDTLCMDKSEIISFCLTSPHRYKTYEIPKRNSDKKRTIAQPSKELKFIQRVLISYLEGKLLVHRCAFAYKSGIGIKNNAQIHLKTKYLLKMDFENFFPSVNPELFFSVLHRSGLEITELDVFLLRNFLFWRVMRNGPLKLSIGAPSSPLISNFIMYYFDEKMRLICNEKGIKYTRYADDLTFSSNIKNVLFEMPNIVTSVLENETQGQITINNSKTVFSSKAHNRHVTGVTLTNDGKLSIGRERKRLISSMIHKFLCELLDQDDILKLQGFISYANFIEDDFYQRMCRKYGEENLARIKRFKVE